MADTYAIPTHVLQYLKQGDENIPSIPDDLPSNTLDSPGISSSPSLPGRSVNIPSTKTIPDGTRGKADTGLSESWEWKEVDDEPSAGSWDVQDADWDWEVRLVKRPFFA
ncbi:hypothetical protein HDV00_006417 [Rhizophlyctis rosea]|nr:hypothetical protein HDV00_006417 [Rhizophlyctis rosea]